MNEQAALDEPQAHPQLTKRMEDYSQTERRKQIEEPQRKREAKQALEKGQNRGRSR